MNRLTIALIVLLVCLAATGCITQGYFKCRECGAACKVIGLPKKAGFCHRCGGRLFECSKAVSGWDEERYQRLGDESL